MPFPKGINEPAVREVWVPGRKIPPPTSAAAQQPIEKPVFLLNAPKPKLPRKPKQ